MKSDTAVKRCVSCTMSMTFPGISFNDVGLCGFCQEFPGIQELKDEQSRLKELMEVEIENSKGKGDYDCIVAYSGGKDSTFTLMHLVQHYGLNCLAVTIDNDFMAPQTVKNCYKVTEKLGVDFVLFKPSPNFMMNMYRESVKTGGVQTRAAVKRVSSICNSCINLINNYMIKLALMHNSPLVAGGYIGGQLPKNASMINLNLIQRESLKKPMFDQYKKLFGATSTKFFFLREELISGYGKNSITIINPMLTLPVGESEIISRITELGWVKPLDTGANSSNCLVNDLGIAIHYKKHNFHAYEYEIAEQVRYGLMPREVGLKKVTEIPEFSQLSTQMNKVGLKAEDI